MADNVFPDMLPGLNLKKGLQRIGGSRDGLLKVLLKFSRNQNNAILKIKKCLAENNPMEARNLVHALTGIAGNIGADDLYTAVCDLGLAIRENKTDEWNDKTDAAQSLMTQLCASIESLAGKYHAAHETGNDLSDRAPDMDKARDLMEELKNAMEGSDAGSIRILEALKESVVDTGQIPELGEIESLLEAYDFDNALAILEKMITRLRGTQA